MTSRQLSHQYSLIPGFLRVTDEIDLFLNILFVVFTPI